MPFVLSPAFLFCTCPVLSGVPQGSVLGPLLFVLFINDLAIDTPDVYFRLFADDVVIFSEVRRPEDQLALNKCLEHISDWCNQLQMALNLDKCVFMRITKKHIIHCFYYSIDGSPLKQVQTFKYLDVIISDDLK